ncbi:MAG: hypothetical protein FWF84_08125, partial [Kiritimatiellaeota bacterium]|nr:hypothetical protein [Kiritimatiellota bacterium]
MKKLMAMMMATAVLGMAQAQTYWWDAGGEENGDPDRPRTDGSGVWDETSFRWRHTRNPATDPSDYYCWVNGSYSANFGADSGVPGTVDIQPAGVDMYCIALYGVPYTFTGGEIRSPSSLRIEPFGGGFVTRFDVPITALSLSGMSYLIGWPGRYVLSKPVTVGHTLCLYGTGTYCLSGKEACFNTDRLDAGTATVASEGALNGVRTLTNALVTGSYGFGMADYADRFVLGGGFSKANFWGAQTAQAIILENGLGREESDFNLAGGYIALNAEGTLDAAQTVITGNVTLGHPRALGDAMLRPGSGYLGWAPGVTADISGQLVSSAQSFHFDVGDQAIVFTNNLLLDGRNSAKLLVRGRPSGSLTLRPPEALGVSWYAAEVHGGTLVFDYADVVGEATDMFTFGSLDAHGGAFAVIGRATGVTTQTMTQISLAQPLPTHGIVHVDSGGGDGTYVNLGSINRYYTGTM